MNFRELHHQKTPLLLCNVWDVSSAKTAEKLKYQAIGTSSAAVANMLGYEDGEEMSFEELKYIVERIAKSVNIPLSVDLEAGFGRDADEIIKNIKALADLGVKGINIEDSVVNNKKREIQDLDAFSKLLSTIISSVDNDVFVNVRTDAFLMGLDTPLDQTIERAAKYQGAGAHGVFAPKISTPEDIKALLAKIKLPLNVMCVPGLPDFQTLTNLGVQRISMGPFPFLKINKLLEKELEIILQDNSANSLF